jgi:hypothetical protein
VSIEDQKSSFYLKMIAQLVDNLAVAAVENANLKKQLAAALAPKPE